MEELAVLDEVPTIITLSTGTQIAFEPLKTRQFFRLIKIITNGAGSLLAQQGDLFAGGEAALVGKLLGLLLYSVPNAENETIEFISSMAKPAGLINLKKLDSSQKAHNDALWTKMYEDLYNPELEDTLDILEAIVRREAADIQALGGKVMKMLKIAEKTGQLKPQDTQKSTGQNSLEDSAGHSTLSAISMDGQTNELRIPVSEDFDNSPQPLPNVAI